MTPCVLGVTRWMGMTSARKGKNDLGLDMLERFDWQLESRSDTWDCASVGRAIGKSTGTPNWKLLISPKESV